MVCSTSKRFAIFIIIVALFSYHAWAQGPSPALYYDSGINLPWAECYAYQEGGSRLKLPFLSVVSSKFRCAPLGIGNYSRDVMVEAPVVFIGNGIIKENTWNSYRGRKRNYLTGNIDVSGKAVMFCYDFPDNIEKQIKNEFPLAKRISEAASRNAAAVILFSSRQKAPFLTVNYDIESDIPEIPVITVTRKSALDLLLYDFDVDSESLLSQWEESGQPPQSVELSAKIHLKIQGNFDKAETKNFLIRFRGDVFSKEEMEKTVAVNEKALHFLFECFKEDKHLRWEKCVLVYFRDFDSKFYYTHHLGWGKASDEGVFMIYKGSVPDFGLAVHENTHILTYLNWGDSTSFVNEGLGKYTEALAKEKDENHLRVVHFLKENQLYPLKEMVDFNIGSSGLKTQVGYPASGSFVAFLMETYGLEAMKKVTQLEGRSPKERKKTDSWQKSFGKHLSELEKEWLYWLMGIFKFDEKYVQKHLKKASLERKVVKLNPEILDVYAGQYKFSNDFIITISKDGNHLYIHAPGMGEAKLVPESESKFTVTTMDVSISFKKNAKGQVTHLIIHAGGGDMRAEKQK